MAQPQVLWHFKGRHLHQSLGFNSNSTFNSELLHFEVVKLAFTISLDNSLQYISVSKKYQNNVVGSDTFSKKAVSDQKDI